MYRKIRLGDVRPVLNLLVLWNIDGSPYQMAYLF